MKTTIRRTPRRYDKVLRTLNSLMESKNERTRLAAALRASEIMMRHQDAEERTAIAIERAAARKAEAGAGATEQRDTIPAPQPLRETAEQFLDRIAAVRAANAEQREEGNEDE